MSAYMFAAFKSRRSSLLQLRKSLHPRCGMRLRHHTTGKPHPPARGSSIMPAAVAAGVGVAVGVYAVTSTHNAGGVNRNDDAERNDKAPTAARRQKYETLIAEYIESGMADTDRDDETSVVPTDFLSPAAADDDNDLSAVYADTSHLSSNELGRALYVAPSSHSPYKIYSGSSSEALAQEVASRLGCQVGRATIGKFSDGECKIQIHDNVRGHNVFVMQSTSFPTNDTLMELILLIASLRRASAERVVAVIPYFSYARQLDRHLSDNRSTIAGADVSLMLQAAGVDQVISVDLHKPQIAGFFNNSVPVENLDTTKIAVPYFTSLESPLCEPVIVTAAGEGVKRATKLRDKLSLAGCEASVALLYVSGHDGVHDADDEHHHKIAQTESMEVIGDVRGRDVIVVDDMIDSGSRISKAADVLHKNGAKRIFALSTHGLFTDDCMKKLAHSPLTEVIVFNTVPLSPDRWIPIIRQLSIGGLLADCIKRIHHHQTLIDLN